MKILVINAGSSSLKYQLIEMDNEQVLAKGNADRIGSNEANLKHSGKEKVVIQQPIPTHSAAIDLVLGALVNEKHGVISSVNDIYAIGHRIVGSGEIFKDSAVINEKTIGQLESIIDFAPLHMPAHIMGIKACMKAMPCTPEIAVFDTTFHTTMPDYARYYGIKYEDSEKYSIRKYGAHGTSHKYISGEAANIKGTPNFNLVVCHLGNGASLSAVKNGKCIDTTMGFTPLEGLIMGTRCGDIDPAVVGYLCDKKGFSAAEAINYLNQDCGVKGISGVSSDFRDLTAAYVSGNKRAELAVRMFTYRVLKYIGSYAAAMNGLDMIAFAAGIGENTPIVREQILSGLEYFGVRFDKKLNEAPGGDTVKLSTADSKVDVYIIPTNEELVIARETLKLA